MNERNDLTGYVLDQLCYAFKTLIGQKQQETTGQFLAALTGGQSAMRTIAASDISAALLASPLRSYLAGLTLSTAGGSATMSIAAGSATDSTNAVMMALTATSKTTGAWAVGAATGGKLSAAAIANSTTYHWHVIYRPDTSVVDIGFDTSPTAPTLPTNYTLFRRIGSWRTDGSAQWVKGIQDGDLFQLDASVQDVSTGAPGASAVTATLTSIPTGVNMIALINVGIIDTAAQDAVTVSDLAVSDQAPSPTAAPGLTAESQVANRYGYTDVQVRTNTSAQVRYRCQTGGALATIKINTRGWIDRRGRDA